MNKDNILTAITILKDHKRVCDAQVKARMYTNSEGQKILGKSVGRILEESKACEEAVYQLEKGLNEYEASKDIS